MSEELLRVQRIGSTVRITFNNPERKNALSPELLSSFLETMRDLHRSSPAIIIITGKQDSFSAGADIHYLQKLPEIDIKERENNCFLFAELIRLLYLYPGPVIIGVNGTALGASVGIIATADFTIAKEGIIIGNPELSIGFAPYVTFLAIALKTGFDSALKLITQGHVKITQATEHPLIDSVVHDKSFEDSLKTIIDKFLNLNINAFARLKMFARRKKWQEFENLFNEAIKENALEYQKPEFITGVNILMKKLKGSINDI